MRTTKQDPFQVHMTLQKIIASIFEELGYAVEIEAPIEKMRIDILVRNQDAAFACEVKFYKSLKASASLLDKAASQIVYMTNAEEQESSKTAIRVRPLLISTSYIDEENKKALRTKYKDSSLVILDISNLLFIVNDNEQIKNDLLAALPFSVATIDPIPSPDFGSLGSSGPSYTAVVDRAQKLIAGLQAIKPGKRHAHKFEEVCSEALTELFEEELDLGKPQTRSYHDMNIMDQFCRIKTGQQGVFWTTLTNYFNSLYVVFEFKNYAGKIGQREVYLTEKYLYPKALRAVAILITQNGLSNNAMNVVEGALRDQGKLILPIEVSDLCEMLEMKSNGSSPSDYLQDKLDKLLLEIGR